MAFEVWSAMKRLCLYKLLQYEYTAIMSHIGFDCRTLTPYGEDKAALGYFELRRYYGTDPESRYR